MYKHTQVGWATIIALGVALVFLSSLSGLLHAAGGALIASIVLIALLLFSTLTVEVKDGYVRMLFNVGLVRKTLKVSDIVSVQAVRNEWWYGYGIHGWWGKGWLINVSGLDAVELKMKNGMVYRIGTDEPQKLVAAIQPLIR